MLVAGCGTGSPNFLRRGALREAFSETPWRSGAVAKNGPAGDDDPAPQRPCPAGPLAFLGVSASSRSASHTDGGKYFASRDAVLCRDISAMQPLSRPAMREQCGSSPSACSIANRFFADFMPEDVCQLRTLGAPCQSQWWLLGPLAGPVGRTGVPLVGFAGWLRLADLRGPIALASFEGALQVIRPPGPRYSFVVEGRWVRYTHTHSDCRWTSNWPAHADQHRQMYLDFDEALVAV